MSCCEQNKEKLCYKAFSKFLIFLFHFLIVMGFLVAGAFIFIRIEEKDIEKPAPLNVTKFIIDIRNKYNFTFDHMMFTNVKFFEEFQTFLETNKERQSEIDDWENRSNFYKQFRKWFYFANVVSTTIGYGDVAPKTQLGRAIFIPFTILAIPAMMTLLARCGDIMTSINRQVFKLILKCCCGKKRCVSESLLSVISITLVFAGYMRVGHILTRILKIQNWTYLDSTYFWFVTFTTVGFGDINYPITDAQYVIIVYRLFGLALLAGFIDSLTVWLNERRKHFEQVRRKNISMKIKSMNMPGAKSKLRINKEVRSTCCCFGNKEELYEISAPHKKFAERGNQKWELNLQSPTGLDHVYFSD